MSPRVVPPTGDLTDHAASNSAARRNRQSAHCCAVALAVGVQRVEHRQAADGRDRELRAGPRSRACPRASGNRHVGELERLAVQHPLDLDQLLAQLVVVAGVGPEVQRGLVERAGVVRPQQVEAGERAVRRRPAAPRLASRSSPSQRWASCSTAAATSAVRVWKWCRCAPRESPARSATAARGRRRVALLDQAVDRGVEQRLAGGGAALGLAAADSGHRSVTRLPQTCVHERMFG